MPRKNGSEKPAANASRLLAQQVEGREPVDGACVLGPSRSPSAIGVQQLDELGRLEVLVPPVPLSGRSGPGALVLEPRADEGLVPEAKVEPLQRAGELPGAVDREPTG